MDCLEKVEISEDAVETDRSSSGHAERAGVGERDGDGEDSLVVVGEVEIWPSCTRIGLKAILAGKANWFSYRD